MKSQVREYCPSHAKFIIDGTLGHGWHVQYFLENIKDIIDQNKLTSNTEQQNHNNEIKILWLDVDEAVLSKARENLQNRPDNVFFENIGYHQVLDILPKYNNKADFVLLDIGINREHILDPNRGFSFKKNWPLDMRFDTNRGEPARVILKKMNLFELTNAFVKYGDLNHKRAETVSLVISKNKSSEILKTTAWLVKLLQKIKVSDPEMAVLFQVIRIITNHELDNLEVFLSRLEQILNSNGVCVILSYHSGEDRIVKNCFKELSKNWKFQIITEKPVLPSKNEVSSNKASRSVKLRAIYKTYS